MSNLPVDPVILITSAAAILALVLYLGEYNRRRKLESSGDKFLEQIKESGWETLNQSIKKSQAILGTAELEGIKVAAETKFETAKLEEQYQKRLEEVILQSQQKITQAQDQMIQYITDWQKRNLEFEASSQKTIQDQINQIFERLETRTGEFLISAESKTISSIELELKSARQLIETYREQQLKLIDENILAMMEQTLNLVLGKKLSLKDQLDLIYEALEKSKQEKFIV